MRCRGGRVDIPNSFKFMLSCVTFTIAICCSNLVFAGAAEKWQYDVIPDKSKNIINVTAKNITQNAANDLTYKVKVVPNSSIVGRTVLRRLFSRNVAAFATVAGIELTLKSLGYSLDYDSQTVYREIKADSDIGWIDLNGIWHNDPNKWGKAWVDTYNSNGATPKAVFNRVELDEKNTAYLWVDRTYGAETYTSNVTSSASQPNPNPHPTPNVREILNPEAIGDIVLGNPPKPVNFSPELPLPSYPPVYSPELPNIFKPVPDVNYPNDLDPAPNQVIDLLDKSQPSSSDQIITTTPTPDGSSSLLPNFCDWATPICSFIDWFKDDSAIPEPEKYEVKEFDKSKLPTAPQFSFNGQCPAPKIFNLNLGLASTQISLPYDYFCSFATDVRPFVILAAWLHACFIFAGFVRS